MRTADDKAARRIDVNLRVRVHHVGRHHAADDLVEEVGAHLLVGHVFAMLARHHDRVHAHGSASLVLHRDLRFAVGPQIVEHAVAARARQAFAQLVRQHNGQRHQLGGFGAGIAEHQPLIAGTAGVDAHADVGRLLVNRREHGAGLGVEAELRARVADVFDRRARDFLEIDDGVGGDFARHHDQAGRDERFAGDTALRILRENGVEDGIGNLIGNLVGMSFGDGLRRKQMAAVAAHYGVLLSLGRKFAKRSANSTRLRAWMEAIVDGAEARFQHVRVDLRRR